MTIVYGAEGDIEEEALKPYRSPRVCLRCGKKFIPSHGKQRRTGHQKYCSRLCYGFARRKPPIEKTCEFCGGSFYVTFKSRKTQKYCSRKCAAFVSALIRRNNKTGMNPTIIQPSPLDMGWAAGVFEGEGTAGYYNNSCLRVTVPQKDKWLLRRLLDLYGGYIHDGGMRKCAVWAIYGLRARDFLVSIFPLLSPRRKSQVTKAVEGYEDKGRQIRQLMVKNN